MKENIFEPVRYDAIYVRQSLYKEESLSIDTQTKMCLSAAKGTPVIYEDRVSGKDIIHRQKFIQMLDDVKRGRIRKIIVYKLDRFSRSLLDFASTWSLLEKHNVEFMSVTESFDTSAPIGEAMIFIMAIFAQLERKQISMRVKDSYWARGKLRGWMGGKAPYGWTLEKIAGMDNRQQGTLVENEHMDIVDHIIMELYSDPSLTLADVRKTLNQQAIPSPEGKSWTSTTVKKIIRNPVYVKTDVDVYAYLKSRSVQITNPIDFFTEGYGGQLYGRSSRSSVHGGTFGLGNWLGTIDSNRWLRCQHKLDLLTTFTYPGRSRRSWLVGLMKCGYCNYSIAVRGYETFKGSVRCIRCSGKDMDVCNHDYVIRIDTIEAQIEKELSKTIDGCGEAVQQEAYNPELERCKAQVHKNDDKIHNLIETLSSQHVTPLLIQHITAELEQIEAVQRELYQKIAVFNSSVSKPQMKPIEIHELSFDEKKEIAYTYIQKIIIYEDSIKIIWKI